MFLKNKPFIFNKERLFESLHSLKLLSKAVHCMFPENATNCLIRQNKKQNEVIFPNFIYFDCNCLFS